MPRTPVTVIGLCALATLVLIASAAAALAGGPGLEKKRLTAADNARAGRAIVRRSDLQAGWQPTKPEPFDQQSGIPGCDPDVSRFTITGRAHSAFKHGAGAGVESEVDIFKNVDDARGDFRVGSATVNVRCAKAALKAAGAQFVSVRIVRAPPIGERVVGFHLVSALKTSRGRVPLYFDFLAFQQSRTIGQIFISNVGHSLAGDAAILARLMALRARS